MIIQHINEIREHFKKEYPKEACGILYHKEDRTCWKPCTNISDNQNSFILNPSEYVEVLKQGRIIAIVHDHIDSSAEASQEDINSCNALGVVFYIFSYPDMELNILHPKELVSGVYKYEK